MKYQDTVMNEVVKMIWSNGVLARFQREDGTIYSLLRTEFKLRLKNGRFKQVEGA